MTTTSDQIPALTGLRALAAYLVFLHHYNPVRSPNWFHELVNQSYIGVSIFFVLSGFLIYHRYAEEYASKMWFWRAYLQNRFARLGALYILLLLVTIGAAVVQGQSINRLELLLNLTVTQGLSEQYVFSGIAQSWSLTVELCFYLSAPVLFGLMLRWGPLRLSALLVGLGLLLRYSVGCLQGHGLLGSLHFVFFYTFFGRAFEFIAGMWLAHRWRILPYRQTTHIGFMLIMLCVVAQTFIVTLYEDNNVALLSEFVFYNGFLPVGICLFLLGLLREKTVIQKLLSTSIVQALGRSSYAFYLIHIGIISRVLQRFIDSYAVLFIVLVVISYVLYEGIEKPLQRRFGA